MRVKCYKISIIITCFFAIIILNSCEKKDIVLENPQQNELTSNLKYELPLELKANLKQSQGLIVFENQIQFDKISNLLMSETEKYIDSYFSKFDEDASVEEVNKLVDEEGFNPNLVFEKFENFHSINSLRAKLKRAEDEWLDNEELVGENPTNFPISERCLAIANAAGEYQIGTTIYKVSKSGIVFEIMNEDYSTLKEIRSSAEAKLKSENLVVHRLDAVSSLKSTSCKAYARTTKLIEIGNRRMEMILDVDWDGYGSAAKAKTLSYRQKKKLFGGYKWGREWCGMTAQVILNDYDINCNYQGNYNSGIKSSNWAYYVSVHVYKTGTGFRVKSGEFIGVHSTEHIASTKLTWFN